uniref:Uncharacterized protein LOC105650339 isoform X1 n=1 Tax=Rhizophora mucronata TaxID=61149 RepID=A0A2P2JU66_RHIMU
MAACELKFQIFFNSSNKIINAFSLSSQRTAKILKLTLTQKPLE